MVRRSLNWQVLIVTFVAAAALGGGLLALHAWQVSRTAGIFLAYADQQERSSQWLQAAGYIDRYLALCPKDAAARVRLAEVFAKGAVSPAQKRRAVDLCYRAIASGAKEKEHRLRLRLAELLLESGRFKEAEREAQFLVTAGGDDQAPAARVLALALWGQLGDGSLAGIRAEDLVEGIRTARRLNPANVELAVVEAQLYRKHARLVKAKENKLTDADCNDRADDSLNSLVTASPKDPMAYLMRHLYRLEYPDQPEAQSDLDEAIRLGEELPEVLLVAGASAYRQGIEEKQAASGDSDRARSFWQKAQEYYEKAISKLADDPQLAGAYLALGESSRALGEIDEAIGQWRQGAEQVTQPIARALLLGRAADLLLAANRIEEAGILLLELDQALNRFDASVSSSDLLAVERAQNLRRALHHAKSRRPGDAVIFARLVIAAHAGKEAGQETTIAAYRLIGDVSASAGQWLEAASAYEQAATLKPADHPTRLASANAWLMAGRPALAAEQAERVLINSPSLAAWLLLASAELQRQVALPLSERSWRRFEQSLKTLESRPADTEFTAAWRVPLLRADYEWLRARLDGQESQATPKVAAILRQVEQEHFSAPDCPLQLVQFYEHVGLRDDADHVLARMEQSELPRAQVAIAKARVFARRGDAQRAAGALDEALRSEPAEQQVALRKEAVQVALDAQDYGRAEKLLHAAHQLNPGDVGILKQLADLAISRGNLKSLEVWEQKLAQAGPWGAPLVHYVRAYRLALSQSGQDKTALEQALDEQSRAVALRPDWAEAYVLRGMIERRLGRLESAVTDYQQAIQLGMQRIGVYEELIGLLDRLNRPADCNRYLSQLAFQLSLSQRLTELAGSHEIRQDHPKRAEEIARQRVDTHPGDAAARLWLGRILMLAGHERNAEAQQELEQAVKISPTDARMWSGLFAFYVHTNQRERAIETLDQLEQKAKLEDAQRSYILAQGHEMLGDFDGAAQHYHSAAKALPKSADVQLRMAAHYMNRDARQAEVHLRRALELDPALDGARRTLALVLAARGGEANLQEAESLLGNLQDRRLAVEDRRLHAVLLIQRRDKESLERALQIMDQVVREEIHPTGDRLILSHIHQRLAKLETEPKAAAARCESARQQLRMAAAHPGAEPAHISALIDYLLQPSATGGKILPEHRVEAGVWLDKLEKIIAERAMGDREAIERLVQLRQRHGSYDRCEDWLNRLDLLDKDPLRVLRLRARLIADQLGVNQAEALIESKAPAMLSSSSDQKQRLKTLRNVGDLHAQMGNFAAAERWYRQAVQEDPAQYQGLVSAVARQGRLDEALTLCEEAARKDGTHVPALTIAVTLVESAPQEEHFRRAEPIISAALAKFATDSDLLYTVAVLRIVQERYDDAVDLLRRTLDQRKDHVDAMNNLAMLLAEKPEMLKTARELIDKAIEVAGIRAELLDTKGAILVYDGAASEAVPVLEQACKLDADPRYSFHLAAAYRGTGQLEKAKSALRAALEGRLESQILTPTDRRLLRDLKGLLTP